MENPIPTVALVGQPNAGKSSLFNTIAGGKRAVTSRVPGTTRDRQYADVEWNGVPFALVDTAGLSLAGSHGDELEENVERQVQLAVKQADLLIFVVDGRQPVAQLDANVLKKFRSVKKPVVLAVSKLDGQRAQDEKLPEFLRLGIKPAFAVSATSGLGTGELLDHLATVLAPKQKPEKASGPSLGVKVAIVGKPNVGKSSLLNKLLGHERAVVSDVAGTTRSAIDTDLTARGKRYTLIDTAGLRRKEHRQEEPDVFSGFQSVRAINRADVCLLVVDGSEALSSQDQRVARQILDAERGCVIVVTKVDLLRGSKDQLEEHVRSYLPLMKRCPLIMVSSKTGRGLEQIFDTIDAVQSSRGRTASAELLAALLAERMEKAPPKLLRDEKKPKVYSLRQLSATPPTFELLVNHPSAISDQFRHSLQNAIAERFGYVGTPVKLTLTPKR